MRYKMLGGCRNAAMQAFSYGRIQDFKVVTSQRVCLCSSRVNGESTCCMVCCAWSRGGMCSVPHCRSDLQGTLGYYGRRLPTPHSSQALVHTCTQGLDLSLFIVQSRFPTAHEAQRAIMPAIHGRQPQGCGSRMTRCDEQSAGLMEPFVASCCCCVQWMLY